jgi:hypothetical protein
LRKVWLSTSTRQDTNIRGFLMPVWNLYFCMGVKHGLLQVKFGVKSKLLLIDVWDTSLEYGGQELYLMESNGPRRCKFRNKKENIWTDWSHTKKRWWRNDKGRLTVEPSGKEEARKTKK